MGIKEDTHLDLAKEFEKIPEYKNAFKHYLLADETGEVLEKLGEYYYLGLGCEQDKEKAKEYFMKAKDFDEVKTDALCNLALCENGSKKRDWYEAAAELGSGHAMNMLGIIAEEDPCDEKLVAKYFHEAAKLGDPNGIRNATFYECPEEE